MVDPEETKSTISNAVRAFFAKVREDAEFGRRVAEVG
jgi:hypothetical protein